MFVSAFISVFLFTFFLAIESAQQGLVWNVSVTTTDQKKRLLNNVVGSAQKGKLHALIGPSGSGKTTFLHTLAGTIPSKSLKLHGEVFSSISSSPIFVQQEDLLFAQLTVEETLLTSAQLKSMKPFAANRSPIDSVSSFVNDLGLKNVKFSRVGDAKTRGVSGGEKKRLSIGNELIGSSKEDESSSNLIFCDEPTSGLDSYQAQKVMELLKDIASKGSTVIASIHQPRSSIFALFDEITLLSEGRLIYTGQAQSMPAYFAHLGYPCPSNVNPCEYYIDLVSIDYSTPATERDTRNRVQQLSEAFIASPLHRIVENDLNEIKSNSSLNKQKIESLNSLAKPSLLVRLKNSAQTFKILLTRAWRQITRDKALNIARLASNLFSALLFGSIYFKLSNSAATVADRLGLLQVAAVNAAMTALIKATTSFVTEKLIVQRERRSGAYTVFPYFLSKLFAEVPLSAFFPCLSGLIMYKLCGLNPAPGRLLRFLGILTLESIASTALGMSVGSLAATPDSALAVAPSVMVIFIVFGGLYVVNTPWYLSWVPNVSLIRWAYEALCINEFTGLELVPQAKHGMLSVTTGDEVLTSLGHKPAVTTLGRAVKAQLAIIVANYIFTYFSLVRQKPSFEQISPNPEPISTDELKDSSPNVTDANFNNKNSKTIKKKLLVTPRGRM